MAQYIPLQLCKGLASRIQEGVGAPLPQGQPASRGGVPPAELTQTATIRNAVNLKKHTLKLVPIAGNENKLSVQFMFDAAEPCRLTAFVLAREEPAEACRLTPLSSGSALGPCMYDKGFNHTFPRQGAPDAEQIILDLARLDVQKLSVAEGNSYPLVLRLETISAKGLEEGHTLQELEVGQMQKVWIQSQTTFASVAKNEDGHFCCKMLKQKIWFEGCSFELQEIYGMEHSQRDGRKTEKEKEEDLEERLCVICLVNDRNTTVLPCRHMCMCNECAQELRKQTSRCPICRNHVESLLHIKMQKKPSRQQVNAAVAAAGGDPAKLTDEFQKLQQQQAGRQS
eukprot:jgi/Astpho2/9535/fgenesh1_pg.00146_%23_2_t